MISEREGDLLDQTDLEFIAHQANLRHTFGAGIAIQIARRYPYSMAADAATEYDDKKKLGTYSICVSPDGKGPNVVNLYSQNGMGPGSTDYAALRLALTRLEDFMRPSARVARLGLPYRLGCGLAGGSWPKVYGIIHDVFDKSPVDVVIVTRPQDVEDAQ